MAIIDELTITFEDGLNIITGETGSGKSLIIKAIQHLMGKRFNAEVLRTGKDTLVIEGVFIDKKGENRIRRIYRSGGESKSYFNDEPIKQKDLLLITKKLIDLHGQHEHQNLLDTATHILYLDSFGNYVNELMQFKSIYTHTKKSLKRVNEL